MKKNINLFYLYSIINDIEIFHQRQSENKNSHKFCDIISCFLLRERKQIKIASFMLETTSDLIVFSNTSLKFLHNSSIAQMRRPNTCSLKQGN